MHDSQPSEPLVASSWTTNDQIGFRSGTLPNVLQANLSIA